MRPMALQFHVEPHAPHRWLDTPVQRKQTTGPAGPIPICPRPANWSSHVRTRPVRRPLESVGQACRRACSSAIGWPQSTARVDPRSLAWCAGGGTPSRSDAPDVRRVVPIDTCTPHSYSPRPQRQFHVKHLLHATRFKARGATHMTRQDRRTSPPRGGEIQRARKGAGFPVHAKLSTARILRPTASSGPTPYISRRARPVIAVLHSRAAAKKDGAARVRFAAPPGRRISRRST